MEKQISILSDEQMVGLNGGYWLYNFISQRVVGYFFVATLEAPECTPEYHCTPSE